MNTAGKRAFITFGGGKPKFSDLAAALRSHSTFNSLWEVSVDNVADACASANKDLTVAAAVTAPDNGTSTDKVLDGNTMMAIEATFSGYVELVRSSALLDLVRTEAVARDAAATLANIGLDTAQNVDGPVRTVRWVASTADVNLLPRSGDRFDVAAGAIANGYADNVSATTTIDESINRAQTNVTISSGGTAPR